MIVLITIGVILQILSIIVTTNNEYNNKIRTVTVIIIIGTAVITK
jgi:hypothetical protein